MKKLLSMFLSLVMVLSLTITASAANEFKDAKELPIGSEVRGNISETNKKELYKFDLSSSSKITIDLTAQIFRLNFNLYDKNGKEIWTDKQTANDTTKEITFNREVGLCKGTYYFAVARNTGDGDYSFTINNTPINESFSEEQGGSNNTPKTANSISLSTTYTGCIAANDDSDNYFFEIKSSGKLNINLNSETSKLNLKICDESGKEAWNDRLAADASSNTISYQNGIYINKGKYYFTVSKSDGEGEYSFDISFAPVDETFAEPHGGANNDRDVANGININQKYNGIIAMNDDVDYYEVNLDKGEYSFNVSSNIETLQLKLYNKAGKAVWWEKSNWDSATKQNEFSHKAKVDSGTYFFSIEKNKGEGNYSFHITDGGAVSEAVASGSVITVRVNGKNLVFDQNPIIEDGRTLVPLRAIFEALGASVNWDGSTQTVTSSKGSIQISLQIGSNVMNVNGTEKTLDVPAQIIGGRTLVPVRAISEAFNCAVNWDAKTKTVIVNDN